MRWPGRRRRPLPRCSGGARAPRLRGRPRPSAPAAAAARWCRPSLVAGRRQEYSQVSGDNRGLKFGVCVNFNVQSSGAQEWAAETRRLSSIRTSNSTYNGSSHLGPAVLHHEHLEDLKSSNLSASHSVRQTMAPNSLANRHASAEPATRHMINRAAAAVSTLASVVKDDPKPINRPNESKVDARWPNSSKFHASLPKISEVATTLLFDDKATDGNAKDENECSPKETVQPPPAKAPLSQESKDARKAFGTIYEKVLVVDDVESARSVVQLLTTKYRNFIHACDTKVANVDKQETPVGHGRVTCFSIYSGTSGAEADFGNGKTCIWVDVLGGGQDVLMEFVPFFEDSSIRKVWHNYSFSSHVIENYGIKVSGFHADALHLARLLDSSMKKDRSEGKITAVEPSLDSMSTLRLYESLKSKLLRKPWTFDGVPRGSMYDFYEEYWRPFGDVLVKMETAGMLVDRAYLSKIKKVAVAQRKLAADKFWKWASKYCPDAKYMNVKSHFQIRQLFFGGTENREIIYRRRGGSTVP